MTPEEAPTHPAAEIFPLIEGPEFDDLVADIKCNGLQHPVVMTPDGQLLDGRNRVRACRMLGETPTWVIESGDPWRYVVSANLRRRHLSDGQRAVIANLLVQSHRPGPAGKGQTPPIRTAEAARLMNIGRTGVRRVQIIRDRGIPELLEAAQSGEILLNTAARAAESFDLDTQRRFLARVRGGANAGLLASEWGAPSSTTRARQSGRRPASDPRVGPRPAGPALTAQQLNSLTHQLDGLELLMRAVTELDPAITNEQAAQFLRGLSKGRRALRGVVHLLNNRKESTDVRNPD